MSDVENVIIVGSGPAGYTAALYTARADLRPLVIEGFAWGGLLQQTTEVENYPGYREGVMGPVMMQEFRDQAERFGTRFITDDATRVELSDGGIHTVWVGDDAYKTKAVVLATGAQHKKLGVPGEDGPRGPRRLLLRDLRRRLLQGARDGDRRRRRLGDGGGDLPRQVRRQSRDRQPPRRVPRLGDHARPRQRGAQHRVADAVRRRGVRRGRERRDGEGPPQARRDGRDPRARATGAFIAVGHEPQSELFAGQVDLDENGYVKTAGLSTRTNLRGVFAAGDLVDHTYRQAITAAGSGCKAALDAEWYLRDTPPEVAAREADPVEIQA